MAIEDVFTLMKPDSHANPDNLNRTLKMILNQTKLEVYAIKWINPTRELILAHYAEVRPALVYKFGQEKGEGIFSDIIDYMVGEFHNINELLAIVYRGPNAIQTLRNLNGATDPEKADPKSIRGLFGEKNYHFGRYPPVIFNVMHCSDSKETRKIETELFFGNNYKNIGRVKNSLF
jgi:nucleoside-diphosphate kinase